MAATILVNAVVCAQPIVPVAPLTPVAYQIHALIPAEMVADETSVADTPFISGLLNVGLGEYLPQSVATIIS
jgi:hypothetical protein